MYVMGVAVLALVSLLVLASQPRGISLATKWSKRNGPALTKEHVMKTLRKRNVVSSLDEEPAAEGAVVERKDPTINGITWEAAKEVFGFHLLGAIIVLVSLVLTWVYVRFIRPQTWFREYQKGISSSVSSGFGIDIEGGSKTIDENDLTNSLNLVPGEAVFFNEEQALSFGGVFGACSKLSVTNLRIFAQRSETVLCGTCSVNID